MTAFVIGISYDGSDFHGWQRQPNAATIQGVIEIALSRVATVPTLLKVAGRTDAGVHATGQVAWFESNAERTPNNWLRGLNALTPDSISIDWVCLAPETFHPRYSATARRYIYVYHDVVKAHPLLLKRVWATSKLNVDEMHGAAKILLGEHDFSSFRGAGCQSVSPMRRINRITLTRQGNFVTLDIEANAFLLHMVRNIASCLHAVGAGVDQIPVDELMAAKNRQILGPTAPPSGLYLRSVSYPEFNLPAGQPIPFLNHA